ncbi:ClbS/DfsB family four-helix bundle protein [Myroides marinus]|uniref:ClbS/DfsB family four-helix bundle protein n=1 Tax=Myroides marinus TaxID=703342 RepID=UPI0025757B38|nr:ClbS/DfsB family four-helix bundle protein [Myroides marinus]MDM1384421.1 ClbS/DfsB family four-helix bundle protein [Myroides marinus]MDM1404262.1 ClbS/DfsB family four-helix bundle protein [Myroides marinus]
MSRPTNKTDLLALSSNLYDKLVSTIESLDKTRLNEDFTTISLNKNVRDVLMHLHEWHIMFLSWYEVGMAGGKPIMPAVGYSWKTTPELNIAINQKHQNISALESIDKFKESHLKVIQIIKQHSDEELFEKKRYTWTGSTSLGAYLISATSSHYDWALKFLKKNSIK